MKNHSRKIEFWKTVFIIHRFGKLGFLRSVFLVFQNMKNLHESGDAPDDRVLVLVLDSCGKYF